MERGKLVAIITGAISLILAIAYLALVQFLDSREMIPAPVSQLPQRLEVVHIHADSIGATSDHNKLRFDASLLPPTAQQQKLA
jgi:hypothetical protein